MCCHRWLGLCPLGNLGQVSLQHLGLSKQHRLGLALTALISSAQGFLNFMNGYTIFLGPFAGIMVTDVRFHLWSISIHLIVPFAVLVSP